MTAKTVEIVALDQIGLSRHLDAVAEILHACVHDGASVNFILPFELNQARAFWLEKVLPALRDNRRIVLIAILEGKIAGTVQLNLDMPPNQSHRAEVAKLLVHPRYRKLGVGRALMQQVELYGANAGRRLLTLDTRTGDAAEPLYASLGYTCAGRIPLYARNPIENRFDAVTLMFKILHQAEDRP